MFSLSVYTIHSVWRNVSFNGGTQQGRAELGGYVIKLHMPATIRQCHNQFIDKCGSILMAAFLPHQKLQAGSWNLEFTTQCFWAIK
jgi:hypothetical protein